jgi:two-component system OmpR family response regulator/two-component system copper resistance phosphate regulon response regulator CusR
VNILIIEDDPVLGRALRQGLEESGHTCEWSRSGLRGLEQALTQKSDAIVLIAAAGYSGLMAAPARRIGTPVLILTALGSVMNACGTGAGADDYLVKPFAFPELLARLMVITRRSLQLASQQLTAGPLSLDLATRRVVRDGQEINLTPTEFSLLEFLMRNTGHVVTRKMLCEHLWQADWEGVTNLIEVHVNRLRAKIDREFETPLLQTVRGRGYVLRSA